MTIETINIQEATEILRAKGMSISTGTLRAGIEQGQFPFGNCIRSPKGSPTYYVYKALMDRWIAERSQR